MVKLLSPDIEVREENTDQPQWKLKLRRYSPCVRRNYIFVGSVLSSTTSCSIVWGAGFLTGRSRCLQKPRKIHAIRGKLSERHLVNQGIPCPRVYGDPALILPQLYQPEQTKKYKYGVIPHYVDLGYKKGILGDQNLNKRLADMNATLIDVGQSFLDFINQVNQCEYIASSSLHGLILAHAYGVPAVWIRFADFVSGHDGFKFSDYFSTTNLEINQPVILDDWSNVERILKRNCVCPGYLPSADHLLDAYPL
ncbi:polysaccharide pyruvyl transferase family protein [Pseudomonadota bacterium]